MKIRPVLNSIAALSAIGVFYTFAFCMVDDVEDEEISKEYYYNTDTGKPEETDMPLMSEDIGIGTLGINRTSAGNICRSPEQADSPGQEDVADVSSKLDNEPGYEAQPEEKDADDGVVITPLTTEQTDRGSEATVTYVPAEAVNEENTAASVETAPAAYTAEPDEADYESIPEDIRDDGIIISENRMDSTAAYINALTNFPSNKEDNDDVPLDVTDTETMVTFPDTQTLPQADIIQWSDPAVTTGLVYSEGTYFETSFTTAPELPANAEESVKSLITYDPVTGAEIFTAKFDGQKQQVDAYKLVCMILSTEMSPSFSQEALKAQAVAAYSYVKYHNINGLVPSVLVKHDIPEEMSAAVSAVWGKCCYYDGAVAQTVYTASTAGSTAKAVNVWGGKDVPYLQSIPTSFDVTDDPNYGVTATYSESYIRQALESYFGITLSDSPENWLVITERVDGNYVANLSVDGQTNVSGRKLRENVLGFGIKSWAFDVSYSGGVFTFVTYG
ncbi:MAG: hypothetical protein NC078_02405 [Ruminococcus sp.]|nr:hypothetical protein [Ruminococcus sp.]